MSAINVNTITNRTGATGPVLSGLTTATNGFHVTSGNVGIGTDNPVSGKLHVLDGNIRISGTSENILKIRHDTAGSDSNISQTDDGSLRYRYGEGERLRITSGGNVGVGSTIPARKLDVVDSGANGAVVRSQVTTNNGGYLAYEALNSSGTSVFSVSHNGRINLAEGINFENTGAGSSTSASAHILDDYEEGTWTVTCANGVTVYAANDQMSYTKIGRQVTVTGQFRVNSGNSNSNLVISALPFVAASNTENEFLSVGTVRVYQGAIRGTAVQVICVGADGTDDLYINEVRDNATDEPVTATNDAFYMISYTYFTA